MADEVSNKLLSGLNCIRLATRSAAWGGCHRVRPHSDAKPDPGFHRGALGAEPPIGDAADALGITPQTASVAIAALVAKSLVTKVPDADDRRASSLKLTRQGEVAARVVAHWPDFLPAAAQELDEAERTLFLHIHQADPAAAG